MPEDARNRDLEMEAEEFIRHLIAHSEWINFLPPFAGLKDFHDAIKSGLRHQAEKIRVGLSLEEKVLASLEAEQQRLQLGQMGPQKIETRLQESFYERDERYEDPDDPTAFSFYPDEDDPTDPKPLLALALYCDM